jgi:peptidylprolyl isomerase/peptidyl-prolyl cis-trans isomerase B (cyclophilin B)
MSDPGFPRQRLPLVVAATIVAVAAVVAIAVGVNHAANVGVTRATPTPSLSPTSAPSPTPAPSLVPFANCSTATFGPLLAPLNAPSSVHRYPSPPVFTIDATKLYQASIKTAKGDIVLCLQPELAPNTVNNFVTLARNHFYDGIPFHRVVAGFVIQAGDPNCIGQVGPAPATPGDSCGAGGPGYQFNDELPPKQAYVVGCLAMANSGKNTNGSQFFICTANDTTLPKSYNLFGSVESGMSVALQIAQGDVMQSVTVAQQQ